MRISYKCMECGKFFSINKKQLEYLILVNYDIHEPIRCDCGSHYTRIDESTSPEVIVQIANIKSGDNKKNRAEGNKLSRDSLKIVNIRKFPEARNNIKKQVTTKNLCMITTIWILIIIIIAGYFLYGYGIQENRTLIHY